MIVNRTYVLQHADIDAAGGILTAIERAVSAEPLRWFVSRVDADGVVVEVTEYDGEKPADLPAVPAGASVGPAVVVNLIPTGIGCDIGGFAGDAAPITALLAASADLVVTNPNAVNASNFIDLGERVLYTEGYHIDLFSRGAVALRRPRANRIGVIVECAEDSALQEVVNVINTVRAVHGVDITDYVVTDVPIGTRCVRNASGAYSGTVDRPDVLLDACRQLLDRGATAIAVTTNVRDLTSAEYRSHFLGEHPNPVGGAEAVLSHLIGRTFAVPAAHAPMINFKDFPVPDGIVDARGAGEFVSRSGLACVLIGLRRAPQIVERPGCGSTATVRPDDVVAVVAPATALGGVPVLWARRRAVPVIAVRDNRTILDVSASALGLEDVIEVGTYAEAAGVVLALRHGISPESIRRPLRTLGRSSTASKRCRDSVPAGARGYAAAVVATD